MEGDGKPGAGRDRTCCFPSDAPGLPISVGGAWQGQVKSENVSRSPCPTLCDPHGLQPTRLLCPWNSPGQHTGVGCHSVRQGIFPTQGSNPNLLGLLRCRLFLYPLSHACILINLQDRIVRLMVSSPGPHPGRGMSTDLSSVMCYLLQWSPALLAPGIDFVKDSFSTDRG